MPGFITQRYSTVNPDNRTGINLSHGVFEAIVMENKDALLMGRLAVYIPDLGGDVKDPQSWKTVRYASPFYGITPYRDSALDVTPAETAAKAQAAGSISASDFRKVEGSMLAGSVDNLAKSDNNQSQQPITSYGMWAVPPDLGVTVLVMFAGGDLNRGFWFACVPTISHGMVPAIGAPDGKTPMAEFSPIDPKVPVTEDLKSIQRQPYQPLVQQLSTQGIQADPARGPITSSSFREAPSNVFGISSKAGHTFVMDDGDQGGKNKLIRLRTAGGNQITMNDDTGFVYIINAKGTGWIELGASGQIDVYGEAGINLATKGDLNMHADQNVSIYAGKCVKIVGKTGTKVQGTEELQLHGKKLWIEGVDALHIHTCKEMMITSFGDIHMKAFSHFCLKGKCFYWNSCTAKEAEQTPPEKEQDVSGYKTTVARAPSHEPYKEHDGGSSAGGSSSPASGATSGSMTSGGSGNANSGIVGNSGQLFEFNGNQQQAFDTVYAAAVKAGSPDPRMTASVAMLESGYLGSSMTRRANNIFGQTILPSQIGQHGIVGGTYGADGQLHAVYESVDAAVADHVRRWGSSYVSGNAQQTTANLVSKGYNTVNSGWAGSINNIYSSSNNTNKPVNVNGTTSAATSTSAQTSTSANTTAGTSSSVKPSTASTSVNSTTTNSGYTQYYNGGGPGTTFNTTGSTSLVLQNAKTTSGYTSTNTTATYNPGTSTNPGTITVTKENRTSVPQGQYTNASTSTTVINASSPAANSYLGRGGAAPVGADPALANVNQDGVLPDPNPNAAGSYGDRLPGDPTGSAGAQTAAQKADQALNQTAAQAPASDVPAGPGGGNTDCFQKGDNCGRPSDGGGAGGGPGGPLGPATPNPQSCQQAYDQLRNAGASHNQALGIMANMYRESGFDSGAIGDGGTSGGYFQYHADRFTNMTNSVGSDWATNPQGQVNYALNNDPVGAGILNSTKNSSAVEVGNAWLTGFEKPAAGYQASRLGSMASDVEAMQNCVTNPKP